MSKLNAFVRVRSGEDFVSPEHPPTDAAALLDFVAKNGNAFGFFERRTVNSRTLRDEAAKRGLRVVDRDRSDYLMVVGGGMIQDNLNLSR